MGGRVSSLILIFLTMLAAQGWASETLLTMCKDQKNCNPSVAALQIPRSEMEINYDGHPFDYCSAFLIAPDKLLTNSHCLYSRIGPIPRPGKSCVSVKIQFPKTTKYKAETAECFQAAAFGDWEPTTNPDFPDYMILILKKAVKRPYIPMRKQALKDHEIDKSYAYDFATIEDNVFALQRMDARCELDMKNDNRPFSEYSPTIFYNHCHLVPGNSGSVLVDSRGRAVGLAMAHVVASGAKTYNGVDVFSDAGVAVNLTCLDTFLDQEKDQVLKEKCDFIKDLQRMVQEFRDKFNQAVQRRDQALKSQSKIAEVQKDYAVYANIVYKPFDNYLADSGIMYSKSFPQIDCITQAGIQHPPSTTMLLPGFEMHAAFDKDYRFNYLWDKEVFVKVQYRVTKIYANSVDVDLLMESEGARLPTKSVNYPICTQGLAIQTASTP